MVFPLPRQASSTPCGLLLPCARLVIFRNYLRPPVFVFFRIYSPHFIIIIIEIVNEVREKGLNYSIYLCT